MKSINHLKHLLDHKLKELMGFQHKSVKIIEVKLSVIMSFKLALVF